jgi:hypothetical protein
MSMDVEYAIKKDVRNNPIVRDVDERQRHDFRRRAILAAVSVVLLVVWAAQTMRVVKKGYATSDLRQQVNEAIELNRRLRLHLDELRSPQKLEKRAIDELHMVPSGPADTIIIERAPSARASKAIVADAR